MGTRNGEVSRGVGTSNGTHGLSTFDEALESAPGPGTLDVGLRLGPFVWPSVWRDRRRDVPSSLDTRRVV